MTKAVDWDVKQQNKQTKPTHAVDWPAIIAPLSITIAIQHRISNEPVASITCHSTVTAWLGWASYTISWRHHPITDLSKCLAGPS